MTQEVSCVAEKMLEKSRSYDVKWGEEMYNDIIAEIDIAACWSRRHIVFNVTKWWKVKVSDKETSLTSLWDKVNLPFGQRTPTKMCFATVLKLCVDRFIVKQIENDDDDKNTDRCYKISWREIKSMC